MNAQESIPTLQATATVLLPGMKHARSLLEVSIRVLEYFQHHAATDAASGRPTPLPVVEPSVVRDAEQVKAMLTAFGRLQEKETSH
jgi:hypothetical protein